MLNCHSSSETPNNPTNDTNVTDRSAEQITRRSALKALFGTSAIAATLPHIPCALAYLAGATGVSSAGYFGWRSYCGHGNSEADSSQGVLLNRPTKVPENYELFDKDRSNLARQALLQAEPNFQKIIDAKQKEAGNDPIEVVFLKDLDTDTAQVVICKKGAMCPCSKPQVYEIGLKIDIAAPEKFNGQHDILHELFKE